jgi:hypothetical protein
VNERISKKTFKKTKFILLTKAILALWPDFSTLPAGCEVCDCLGGVYAQVVQLEALAYFLMCE